MVAGGCESKSPGRWERRAWRAFCRHGTIFIACWRGRGTSFINGREIVPVDEAQKGHWRSVAVQFVSEPEICHGAECLLGAAVRVRVPGLLRVIVSGSESCKKHDNSVSRSFLLLRRLAEGGSEG
jgi:hypothetical protein